MTRPTIVCTLTAYTNPVFLDAVKAIEPEGVKITGNGTLPHPLKVELSGAYKAAPALLAGLKNMVKMAQFLDLENDPHFGKKVKATVKAARAAIAAAEGDQPTHPENAHEFTGEPDPCDLARDYNEGVIDADQPTPYDL